ncbi:uncharacterized protein LOC144170020 [Haemaphysalis longicornis]
MRRDNLFLPLRSGGVGLVHLFVHQLVSRFFFIKTADHPFLKVFIQHKLSAHLPFLFAPTHPANPRPLWGFLKEVADTFKFLVVRFSLKYLYGLSRKELTGILIESLFPVPIYRQPYLMFLGDSVLKRVNKMCIQAAAKTFFFKLHPSTLPVKTWLNIKGVYVPWSVNCRLCNQPETIDHCFVLCGNAVFFFLDVLQRTLKKGIDITPYSIRFLPVMKKCAVPYDLFVMIGFFSLWKCRMIDRHAGEPRGTKSIFREQCALVYSVYAAQSKPPNWLHFLEACVCLPDF